MKTIFSFLLILALGIIAAGQGGKFWQQKDYRQWSAGECQKLLTDSPWAQTYTLKRVLIESIQQPSTNPSREQLPYIEYQVQFWSARPIRQAVVRLSQLGQKYDRMTPEQRQEFDRKAEEFLAARFPDTVVLRITYSATIPDEDNLLARHWRHQTKETLRNSVYLIAPGGKKVPLLNYTVGQGAAREFDLIFPREVEGRPLIGPGDKTLQLEFVHPNIRGQAQARVLIVFKVEKMLMQGAVVF